MARVRFWARDGHRCTISDRRFVYEDITLSGADGRADANPPCKVHHAIEIKISKGAPCAWSAYHRSGRSCGKKNRAGRVIAARARNGLASALTREQNHAWMEALAPSSGRIE
jgi:hypothetical protein